MENARSQYKPLIRQTRYTYNVSQTRKLEDMRYKNAKEYWSLLTSTTCQGTIEPNISTQRFAEYFRAVNDPQSTFFFNQMKMYLVSMKGF